ncbi:MAG: hypothetical protein ACPF9D_13270, partial [Owenweeksia sp.]
MNFKDRLKRFRILLLNWEYWPWKIVYIPLFLQYFWHGLRSGFSFPTVLNRPYMSYGGIFEESKWEMFGKTPPAYMPPTLFFKAGWPVNRLIDDIRQSSLPYPVIVKPDRGMRGKGVEIIRSESEFNSWTPLPGFDFIVQPFLDYPKEIGAFVLRHPGSGKWMVSSLMERQFLVVHGDGISNLEKLIRENDRAFLQLQRWKQSGKYDLKAVPGSGAIVRLGSIGNHRLGTCFLDARHHLDEQLSEMLISIARELPGFEYGRMDIRFQDW